MADRALKSILAAMKSVQTIQNERSKLMLAGLENSEKFRNQYFQKMMDNKMDMQNKQAFKQWENQPENMSPQDKMAYENQIRLKQQYEQGQGASSQPAPQSVQSAPTAQSAPIGIQQIAETVANRKPSKAPPPAKIEKVVMGDDGKYKTLREDNPDYKAWERQQTAIDKTKSEMAEGRNIAFNNLEKVAGSLSDLDKIFTEGHEKGQLGSLSAEMAHGAAKLIGGSAEDKFSVAAAFTGKKAEVLFNMIPMLTQQGNKPGSVRIMESVLRLLGATLPEEKTGLKAGRNMMGSSIRSFYRFARAAELAGLSFDKEFANVDPEEVTEQDLKSWINKVKTAEARVNLDEEEQSALDNFTDTALSASGKLLKTRGEKETPKYSIGQEVTGGDGRMYKITGGDMTDPTKIQIQPVTPSTMPSAKAPTSKEYVYINRKTGQRLAYKDGQWSARA